jgi:RNA polymerase sigma-70 factor (ECF subfamily)
VSGALASVSAVEAAEAHRTELTGYCYRMLGSGFEAEDAVQETLVRAWRHGHRFDPERGSLRTWLHAIATRVCLDMLRSPQRRARAVDLGPAATPGDRLGRPLPESAWVLPVPDERVLTATDPAELAAQRETVRLAFVAALQLLAPRQRAALVLREVLRFSAAEVAQQLDTSVSAVNSAVQRARATLRDAAPQPSEPLRPDEPAQRDLLERFCAAFERYDVDALVALMHEDVTMQMPPFTWWLRGRAAVEAVLRAAGRPCEGARMVPVAANGSPAFWQTRPTGHGGAHEPFGLQVLDVADGLVVCATTFLDAARLAPLFAPR